MESDNRMKKPLNKGEYGVAPAVVLITEIVVRASWEDVKRGKSLRGKVREE